MRAAGPDEAHRAPKRHKSVGNYFVYNHIFSQIENNECQILSTISNLISTADEQLLVFPLKRSHAGK